MSTAKKQIKTSEELEKEFLEAVKKAKAEAEIQLKIARKAIVKVEKIAEKYGVPIDCDISPLYNTFTPESLEEKWKEIDAESFDELFGEAGMCIEDTYAGWQHSAVC